MDIVVSAEPRTAGIHEYDARRLFPRHLPMIPHSVWCKLTKWTREYTALQIRLIGLPEHQSESDRATVVEFDFIGRQLANEVAHFVGSKSRILYYSEGRGSFLNLDGL